MLLCISSSSFFLSLCSSRNAPQLHNLRMNAVFLPSMFFSLVCSIHSVENVNIWQSYCFQSSHARTTQGAYTECVCVLCIIHVCIIKWCGIWSLWHGIYSRISNNHFNRVKIILHSLESIYANLGLFFSTEFNARHTHRVVAPRNNISIGLCASTSYQHKCWCILLLLLLHALSSEHWMFVGNKMYKHFHKSYLHKSSVTLLFTSNKSD